MKRKSIASLLIGMFLSACSSPPKGPIVWQIQLIGSSFDHYLQQVECAYRPIRTDTMGHLTVHLPRGQNICPRYGKYYPQREWVEFPQRPN